MSSSKKIGVLRVNAGTPPIFILTVIVFLVLCLALLTVYISDSGAEEDHAREASEENLVNPCEESAVRADCSFVATSAGEFRYSLIRGTGESAVIVDVGGPGTAVLSGQLDLEELASSLELPEHYSILFIEEPWVREPISDECNQYLGNFYLDSRDPGSPNTNAAEAVVDSCGISTREQNWGFDENSYSEVVSEIESSEGIQVDGFLGYSFGSARLSYLGDREFEWVSLIRPFPVGATGEDLIESRSLQVERIFTEHEPPQAGGDGAAEVAGRSTEVDEFDYVSAEIAVGYLEPDDIASRSEELRSRSNDQLAGQLSDSLWLRYGENSVSPGYLAYLYEVCGISEAWQMSSYGSHSHESVISGMHAPCSFVNGESAEISAEFDKACVVTSDSDPLTDPELTRDSLDSFEEAVWINSDEISHSSSDGTIECLQAVVE